MINPHICYIAGFGISLTVYLLGWSEIYPRLELSLLAFLIGTIILHILFSKILKKNDISFAKENHEPKIDPWIVTVFLYVLWSIDFLNEGGIPLFKVLLNKPFDYKQFGFPLLHVLAVSFGSFYCVYLFYLFLDSKRRFFLWVYLLNMLPAVLIYSRAMLFFNIASSVFVWILSLKKIPYRKIALTLPLAVILMYLFGVAGTKRVSFEAQSPYSTDFFLNNAGATKQFKESSVPKEFFWSYFYISSPLANLQLNVSHFETKPITFSRILEYINNELLFESLSKRFNQWFHTEREMEYRIKEQFNVSTVYSTSYSYLGWAGMCFTALVVILLPGIYSRLMISSPYSIVGNAILCTTFLFMSYDNTIRLMGLGFQLVYPILFPMAEKMLVKIQRP